MKTNEELFEEFWEKYPKKINRFSAKEQFLKALLDDPKCFQKIIEKIETENEERTEWPSAFMWLRQRRWEWDE